MGQAALAHRVKTAEEEYDEYFTPEMMEMLNRSIAQAERGDVITFTMDELISMEDGSIPQRALDWLAEQKRKYGDDL